MDLIITFLIGVVSGATAVWILYPKRHKDIVPIYPIEHKELPEYKEPPPKRKRINAEENALRVDAEREKREGSLRT